MGTPEIGPSGPNSALNGPNCPHCPLPLAADGTPLHARSCPSYTGKIRDGWNPNFGVTGARYRVRTADGQIRTATLTADADTFWTVPARVSVRGRTVTGHVYAETLRPIGEWRFSAYAYRKNADALPDWSDTDPITDPRPTYAVPIGDSE